MAEHPSGGCADQRCSQWRLGLYVAVLPSGPTSAGVYLVDDAGDSGGPYAPLALPSAGTAANSQCTINGTGSSLSQTGNTMTLALSITFAGTWAGDKIAFLAVQDTVGVNSGWHAMGTWNVPGAAPVGPAVGRRLRREAPRRRRYSRSPSRIRSVSPISRSPTS